MRLREAVDVRYRCFHALWGSNVWQNPWCVYDQKHSEYAIWPEDMTANKVRERKPPPPPFSAFYSRTEQQCGAGNRQSPLYLYNHLFYTDGMDELPRHLRFIINRAAGHFETSDYCKSHCTQRVCCDPFDVVFFVFLSVCVGPLLNYDTIKAWKVTRRRPNFVNVDFYQVRLQSAPCFFAPSCVDQSWVDG